MKDKMEDLIFQQIQTQVLGIVQPNYSAPEKEDLKPREYIDAIKVPRFDSDTPEEWIIFVDLIQKAFVGQNVTTDPSIYKCIEKVLKGDVKAECIE